MRRVLLAGAVLAASCRAPAPETRFLNFDAASGGDALGVGWSSFERSPEGDTFVWGTAREATLVVSAAGDADRLLRFRCWPYWFEGAPTQSVRIDLNGATVGRMDLKPDRRVYSVYVPRTAWRRGANALTLGFAYTARPSEHGEGDGRALAVAFDWMEIVPPARPR